MRACQTLPALLVGITSLAIAPFAAGQKVTLVPDVGVAQAEYHEALESWLQNDRNLEKELLTGEPEQMRRRVKKAAALRDDVMVKKQTYLDLIIARLRETRAHLAPANASEIPVKDLKKDLEAQQGRILGDQERLDDFLRSLPEGDEYLLVRRALDAERASLVNLQNTVALRIRSLDNLDKSQDAVRAAASGETEAQKLDEVLKIWDQERAAAIRQRSTWANLYKGMEQAIDDRAASQKKSAPAVTSAGVPASPQKPPPGYRAVPPSASTGPVKLTGTWVYRSQPGAWSGFGEPQAVTLELHKDGGSLRGLYSARLPMRGGVHAVTLSLSGPFPKGNTVKLHWTSQSPAAEGEMELRLATDGRLQAERTASGDGSIPLGMELLSVR